MACSARLPVYALLISFLWRDQPAWKAGLTLAGLYLGALVIGSLAASILNRIVSRHGELSSFMMELPLYRLPRLKVIVNQSVTRTFSYVKRAGPIIFGFAVLMWVGTTFPNYTETDAHTQLETSYLGKAGKVIEPIFEPMGMDWRAGVGLVSAFAARQVFVSTLAVVMNITSEDEAERDAGLLGSMSEAVNSAGKKIFTGASVAGLIFFFMIALQCISTYSIVVREMGSVKLALLQLVVFNVVAYVGAVVINQVFG
jgi:ferrous iron transport protein B